MKVTRNAMSLVSMIALGGVLAGCGGAPGGSAGGGTTVTGVTSAGAAQFVVTDLASRAIGQNLLQGLTLNTSPSGQVVAGTLGGSATVSGTFDFTSSSCGSNCVTNSDAVDLTMVFTHYTVMTASNTKATVDGTVSYSDHTWSEQSNTSFYSGGSMSLTGSGVHYRVVDVGGYWGYDDTLAFNVSGPSPDTLSGQCASGSGTFTF